MTCFYFEIKFLGALVAGIRKDRAARFRAVGLPGRFFIRGCRMLLEELHWEGQQTVDELDTWEIADS